MPKELLALADAPSRRSGPPLSPVALGWLTAILLATPPVLGAPPPEEPRIVVDALVLDPDGNPVRGLNRGDFEVIIGERVRPVSDARMVEADVVPRRFVFVREPGGAPCRPSFAA